MRAAEDLFTEKEVAEKLGYSRNWLRRKRLNGEAPPHIKPGNKVMYRGRDVDAWLDNLESGDAK